MLVRSLFICSFSFVLWKTSMLDNTPVFNIPRGYCEVTTGGGTRSVFAFHRLRLAQVLKSPPMISHGIQLRYFPELTQKHVCSFLPLRRSCCSDKQRQGVYVRFSCMGILLNIDLANQVFQA